MGDFDLLQQYVVDHSQAAFAAVVERHVSMVYSACVRQLHDKHMAEDVTQAVFVILAQKAGTIPRRVVLAAWLLKTARYCCTNARSLRRNRTFHESQVPAMEAELHIHPAEWSEVEDILDEGLETLGQNQRDVLVSRFFEGKSIPDIARDLKLTEYTTEKRLSRGLTQLRRFLSGKGVTIGVAALALHLAAGAVKAAPSGLADLASATAIKSGLGANAALNGTIKILVQRVSRVLWRGQLKALAAACLTVAALLGILGIGGTLAWRAAYGAVAGNTALSTVPAGSLTLSMVSPRDQVLGVLADAAEAFRRMDSDQINRTSRFTGVEAAPAEWEMFARVLRAQQRLSDAVEGRFGPETVNEIMTLGRRIDAVAMGVKPESVRVDFAGNTASVSFAFTDDAAGGTIYLRNSDSGWQMDATRSFTLALATEKNAEPVQQLDAMDPAARAAVLAEMAQRSSVLNQLATAIDQGHYTTIAAVNAALDSASARTSRLFFTVALKVDQNGQRRGNQGVTLE